MSEPVLDYAPMTMGTVDLLFKRGLREKEPLYVVAAALYTIADEIGKLKEVLERNNG